MVTRDTRLTQQRDIDYNVELYKMDELNQVNKAVDTQLPVDVTEVQEVQKDISSNPGDEVEYVINADGTRMGQDGKIMSKPGLRKNKLVAKYGTNFRYLGIVKNGIDRVTVVTLIPIPRYKNIKVQPITFSKCTQSLNKDSVKAHGKMADTQASKAAKEWCAQAIP